MENQQYIVHERHEKGYANKNAFILLRSGLLLGQFTFKLNCPDDFYQSQVLKVSCFLCLSWTKEDVKTFPDKVPNTVL